MGRKPKESKMAIIARTYVENEVRQPVYKAVIACASYDEARKLIRQAKPVNVQATKTVGIFATSPYLADSGFTDVSGTTKNVVVLNQDKSYVSENATVRGIKGVVLYVTMGDGQVRHSNVANSFLFEVA